MSEELKCPFCGGTASIAYHCASNNLLYCHDCKRTFSERDAKNMEQAFRIEELEKENREQLIDYENSLCEARKYQQDAVKRCEEFEQERNKLEAERDRLREALEEARITSNARREKIIVLKAERDHFREVAEKLVWLYSDEHQGRLDNGLRIDGFYSHEWLGMILDMAREAMKGAGE